MKNTLIPLDIIWIGEDKKVVFVRENVQPCRKLVCPSIFPNQKARYVLELNAGICQERDIKQGDELKIEVDK